MFLKWQPFVFASSTKYFPGLLSDFEARVSPSFHSLPSADRLVLHSAVMKNLHIKMYHFPASVPVRILTMAL